MLSEAQVEQFWRDGYLVVPDAVTMAELAAMRAEIASWVEASRAQTAPFGPPDPGRAAALRHGRRALGRDRRSGGSTIPPTSRLPSAPSWSARQWSTWSPT